MRRVMRILCLIACMGVAGLLSAQAPQLPDAPSQVGKEERLKRGLPLDANILAPRVIFAPEPEYPEEARKHKARYNVLVHVQIDKEGKVREAQVMKSVGYGLDEGALAAARQYRFRPATQDGVPIPWDMQVEINFQIF